MGREGRRCAPPGPGARAASPALARGVTPPQAMPAANAWARAMAAMAGEAAAAAGGDAPAPKRLGRADDAGAAKARQTLRHWDGVLAQGAREAVAACLKGASKELHVVEGALPPAVADAVHTLMSALPRKHWLEATAETDDRDAAGNAIRHRFAAYAREDAKSLSKLFSSFEALADGAPCSLQLARYGAGDGIAPHDDSAVSLRDGRTYERHVALVLHMAKGNWTVEDGGCFIDCETKACHPPGFNRLLCFAVPRMHEVTAVQRDGSDVRYSLFGWVLRERRRDPNKPRRKKRRRV